VSYFDVGTCSHDREPGATKAVRRPPSGRERPRVRHVRRRGSGTRQETGVRNQRPDRGHGDAAAELQEVTAGVPVDARVVPVPPERLDVGGCADRVNRSKRAQAPSSSDSSIDG